VADAEGKAHYERTDSFIAFGGDHSIIGLAVVIHAGKDDFTSQPSGAAGPRVACGVIGIAK
jgi:Cu-Zn family superoxide dismutase